MPKVSRKMRVNSAGYCFVEIGKTRVYLGKQDDPNTERQYYAVLADHLARTQGSVAAFGDMMLGNLAKRYKQYCATYYSSGNQCAFESKAVDQLVSFVGAGISPRDFGPRRLKEFRDLLVNSKICRATVNQKIGSIRRMFKWAVSEELIPVAIHTALITLSGLKAGRTDAVEHSAVGPVSLEHVEAVRPFVSRQVWTIIQLQLLTGARPGEIVGLRPCDIDRSDDMWVVRMLAHKTAYKGRTRVLYLGPQAQALLGEWLAERNPETPLFSPIEATRERHDRAAKHRRQNQAPSVCMTKRTIGDSYDVAGYRRAIRRACLVAKVPAWHPHQLRHTAATRIRQRFGLEAAQVALGHATADVTQIYAERDATLAKVVFNQIG